ncbi:MAG: MFS transporter [Spirochaetaceae bacterium]|jgi:GPH family glycoside/pentoside/hexuronide:cation symporter|nr:MFS transporter [Spirochaetaceae bacterium]
MEKKPLSSAIKTLYGIGDFGFGLMASVETFFFVFFLSNVAKFPEAWVIGIGTATAIGDAILSPVYGGIISSVKPLRWGRNRSWMILMPPLVVVTYIFMFTKISSNNFISAAVIVAGFIVSHIFWNLGWVANLNLIPTLATTPRERGMLSSRRMMYTSLAQMSFSYIGAPLIAFYTARLGSELFGYPATAGTLACVMLIGYLVIVRITKGYEPTGAEEAATAAAAPQAAAKEKVSFGDLIKSVTQNPHLVFLLLGDFFRYMSTFVYSAAVAFYFTYVAKDMKLMPLYLLIASFGSLAGATAAGQLSKKFSHRTLVIAGLLGAAITMILGKVTGLTVVMVFVCGTVSRIFIGALGAWVVAMYSEASIYSEWKTGRNATAFIMGTMNLSLKAAIITRGTVIPIVLGAVGFVSGLAPELATIEIQQGILTVFMLVPGSVTLLSCLFIGIGYRLTNEKLETYQKEINARKAA